MRDISSLALHREHAKRIGNGVAQAHLARVSFLEFTALILALNPIYKMTQLQNGLDSFTAPYQCFLSYPKVGQTSFDVCSAC